MQYSLKNDRRILACFQGKTFSITVIQVYAPATDAEQTGVERFYEDIQELLEHKKIMSFSSWGLECNSRKSRDTWSNRQVWPWSTEWSRSKTKSVWSREHTSHSKHPLPTTQEMTLHMDIPRWSILKPDLLYFLHPKMEKFYTVSKNKTSGWPWLRSWALYCKIQA